MIDSERFAQSLRQNAEAFEALLPGLLESDRDRCAVLRDGAVVALFDTMIEAASFAQNEFPDGLFSLRKVDEQA